MKRLQTVTATLASQLMRQFPDLLQVRQNEEHGMGRFAISVFDHWLRDPAEWHLLDCYSGAEREARNTKFMAHWAALFDTTEVYTIRYRGRWPRKAQMVIKRYKDRRFYLTQCRYDPVRAPEQFVILPEFDCLFAASWDDTNVAYYNDRAKATPVITLAQQLGLHCLECD